MGVDHSLGLRRRVIEKLRDDPGTSAIVGDRVYGKVPSSAKTARPYLRYGVEIVSPYEASGLRGSEVEVTIHVFDEGADSDRCRQAMEAVRAALDGEDVSFDGGYALSMDWRQSQILTDEPASRHYHGLVRFDVVTDGSE